MTIDGECRSTDQAWCNAKNVDAMSRRHRAGGGGYRRAVE